MEHPFHLKRLEWGSLVLEGVKGQGPHMNGRIGRQREIGKRRWKDLGRGTLNKIRAIKNGHHGFTSRAHSKSNFSSLIRSHPFLSHGNSPMSVGIASLQKYQ